MKVVNNLAITEVIKLSFITRVILLIEYFTSMDFTKSAAQTRKSVEAVKKEGCGLLAAVPSEDKPSYCYDNNLTCFRLAGRSDAASYDLQWTVTQIK